MLNIVIWGMGGVDDEIRIDLRQRLNDAIVAKKWGLQPHQISVRFPLEYPDGQRKVNATADFFDATGTIIPQTSAAISTWKAEEMAQIIFDKIYALSVSARFVTLTLSYSSATTPLQRALVCETNESNVGDMDPHADILDPFPLD